MNRIAFSVFVTICIFSYIDAYAGPVVAEDINKIKELNDRWRSAKAICQALHAEVENPAPGTPKAERCDIAFEAYEDCRKFTDAAIALVDYAKAHRDNANDCSGLETTLKSGEAAAKYKSDGCNLGCARGFFYEECGEDSDILLSISYPIGVPGVQNYVELASCYDSRLGMRDGNFVCLNCPGRARPPTRDPDRPPSRSPFEP